MESMQGNFPSISKNWSSGITIVTGIFLMTLSRYQLDLVGWLILSNHHLLVVYNLTKNYFLQGHVPTYMGVKGSRDIMFGSFSCTRGRHGAGESFFAVHSLADRWQSGCVNSDDENLTGTLLPSL